MLEKQLLWARTGLHVWCTFAHKKRHLGRAASYQTAGPAHFLQVGVWHRLFSPKLHQGRSGRAGLGREKVLFRDDGGNKTSWDWGIKWTISPWMVDQARTLYACLMPPQEWFRWLGNNVLWAPFKLATGKKPPSLKDINCDKIQDQDFVENEKNQGRGTEEVNIARHEWAAVDIRAHLSARWLQEGEEWGRAQTFIVENIKLV